MAGGARAHAPPGSAAAGYLRDLPEVCRRVEVPSTNRYPGTYRTGSAGRCCHDARRARRGGGTRQAVERGDRLVALAKFPDADGGRASGPHRLAGGYPAGPHRPGRIFARGAASGARVARCALRARRAQPGASRRPVHMGGRAGGGTGRRAGFGDLAERKPALDAATLTPCGSLPLATPLAPSRSFSRYSRFMKSTSSLLFGSPPRPGGIHISLGTLLPPRCRMRASATVT